MPRKRHTTACDLCRSRKVGCDAVSVGVPCSNCSKHSSHCSLSLSQSPHPQPHRAIPSARTHKFKVKAQQDHVSGEGTKTLRVTSDDILETTTPDFETRAVNNGVDANSSVQLHLPAYITPLSSDIDPGNLQFLVQRDALAFPPPDIVDDLIQMFVCYVYPLLPIVRLDTFLDALEGKEGNTISPLPFQAILLAGAVFADFSKSRHPSFQQSKEVQKMLFGRAKLLYDMEVESDPVTVVQSCLLMTYWHSQLNDIQGRVHWLRIALSLATEAGLHDSNLQYEDPEENAFRRQLWNCCIIRTSLICIGERRQVSLPQAASNHYNLSSQQWNGIALSRALDRYSIDHTREQLEMLRTLFTREVELCRIIQHTLETLYELSGVRPNDSGIPMMVLIPKTEATGSLVMALDEKLRAWHKQISGLGLFERQRHHIDSIVPLHSAVLEMLYYTALSTVHRPMMLQQRPVDTATEALRVFSAATLRSSACRITEIGRDLELENRIAYLPPVATAMFIAASLQHLQDAMSQNLDDCRTGSLYLGQVLRIFRLLTERYNHVNGAIEYISRIQNGERFDHALEWEERVNPTSGWQTSRGIGPPR